MANKKDGGIGVHIFQVLVDIYHRDKVQLRRALLTEIIPLADDPTYFGDTVRKVFTKLIRTNVLTQEDIDWLKSQL